MSTTIGLQIFLRDGRSIDAVHDSDSILIGSGPSAVLRLDDPNVSSIHAVVKVSPDGRENIVRGVRLGAVPPATFRDLLEASREQTLYSARSTVTSAVSVIVPNLIFEELEIQQTREILQKPPVVPSPLGD